MPDGSKGFSLLIIITADFPPIQLGFGFTLNGVGGLLGLNRTVNIEVLREGVRTNAIKSILFPQDVVANITRIVSDIKQIFPPYNDHFVVGPMAKLGWGTPSIITMELGMLLEIPVPRIAILGVLHAFLPTEDVALLNLQVNFLGVIDFENKYISFDASLFDSRLLIYTLTGDMAFRLSWGDNPMFILSVGGFHPAYHDAPPDLQHMTRLGISLLGGDNPRISVMSYFAVTSNTVQFGARAELYAAAAGFNVYGFIGYDVLFQFDPFQFIASLEAGLALREGTSTIMGIHLSGQLSGPSPWNARGDASINILFFSISVGFHETWGDDADKVEPPKEDLLALLTVEINDNRNWRAEIPSGNNLHVSIRDLKLPPEQLVIHPMGVLTFSERLVPLGLDIDKFGNKRAEGREAVRDQGYGRGRSHGDGDGGVRARQLLRQERQREAVASFVRTDDKWLQGYRRGIARHAVHGTQERRLRADAICTRRAESACARRLASTAWPSMSSRRRRRRAPQQFRRCRMRAIACR